MNDLERAVVEAAKQKYRSLVYTSGVSQEFADAEIIKTVKALTATPEPAKPCCALFVNRGLHSLDCYRRCTHHDPHKGADGTGLPCDFCLCPDCPQNAGTAPAPSLPKEES